MKNITVLFLTGIIFIGCSILDSNSTDSINFQAIISTKLLKNSPSDPLTINNLKIEEDSLTINFSASGCNGNSWKIKLIADELIAESLPPQRQVKLSLKNDELCEAFISKELTFDISNLQVEGNELQLNFMNSNESILYEY